MSIMRLFWTCVLLAAGLVVGCQSGSEGELDRQAFADTLRQSLRNDLVAHWYPRAIDSTHGGYLSHFAHDWTPLDPQQKFIVTQARHLWATARLHQFAPRDDSLYLHAARQGVDFLRTHMWDGEHGGFHSLVDQEGNLLPGSDPFTSPKTAYGNAFAIYGLVAAHAATGDTSALNLARRTFRWLDAHAYDDTHGGYFQSLHRNGTPYVKGYTARRPPKDQNSTIHLLEAFTALYKEAPNSRLRNRLEELLVLTRDTMTTDRGYLWLFYERDWTPVSYRDSSKDVREANYTFDHVSFGHDVETAFLMLSAAEALGLDPAPTLAVSKRMVDHALAKGWDGERGGFYDAGYYMPDADTMRIIRPTKAWWSQAEALHTFVLMNERFPDASPDYGTRAQATWQYIDRYLIDDEHGGWYMSGLDQAPDARTGPKGTIWKGTYHTVRALAQSIEMLEE